MNSNHPQKPTLALGYYHSEVAAFVAGVALGATVAQSGQG